MIRELGMMSWVRGVALLSLSRAGPPSSSFHWKEVERGGRESLSCLPIPPSTTTNSHKTSQLARVNTHPAQFPPVVVPNKHKRLQLQGTTNSHLFFLSRSTQRQQTPQGLVIDLTVLFLVFHRKK